MMLDKKLLYSKKCNFSIEKRGIVAYSFAKSASDYIEENYKALADISINMPDNSKIVISPDYAICMLIELLFEVRGKDYLKIDFSLTDGVFHIKVYFGNPRVLSFEALSSIICYARDSGFEVKESKEFLDFFTPVSQESSLKVYASERYADFSYLSMRFNYLHDILFP